MSGPYGDGPEAREAERQEYAERQEREGYWREREERWGKREADELSEALRDIMRPL